MRGYKLGRTLYRIIDIDLNNSKNCLSGKGCFFIRIISSGTLLKILSSISIYSK